MGWNNIIGGMCRERVVEAAWDLDQGRAILSQGIQETRGTLGDPKKRVRELEGLPPLEARLRWRGRPAPGSGGRCPPSAPGSKATRGGQDYLRSVYPRGGRLLVGGGGTPARWRPRGWASPGLGEGMAGFARGMDSTRALRPPQGWGGAAAPPQTSGGDSHPRRRQVAA